VEVFVPNETQNIDQNPKRDSGSEVGQRLLGSTPWKKMNHLVEKFLLLDELEQVCVSARKQAGEASFFARLLKSLDLTCDCSEEDLRRIPSQGPVVVVANHPFGLAEGPSLGSLLLGVRSDIRFLANSLLLAIPELREYVIAVDPFGGDGAVKANLKPLREAIEWVRNGGLLIVFPAGEVASIHPPGEIRDPAWNESVARLVRMTSAAVVPVFFHGANSAAFHIAGLAHPRLRTILLSREFLNKRGTTIRVSIGGPIQPQVLSRLKTHRDTVDYLRERTQLLRVRKNPPGKTSPEWPFPWMPQSKPAEIAPPVDAGLLRDEIERLGPDQKLVASGEYLVCMANAGQIPNIVLEIGRLREISFREAGEGTGRALDLDVFDKRYEHLFVWNRERNQVVGAYRLAGTDVMQARFGSRGLYTNTLFRFRPDFLPRINPAIELGRSFVRPEHQKSYVPLLLLWKGIGQFVAKNPRYRMLFGPVSISKDYSSASQALIVSFLKAHCYEDRLARSVSPKSKFRAPWFLGHKLNKLTPLLRDIEELSKVVADLEPDKKGVPVLLRQYLNIGGQILDFSVDSQFSRVLDGLIVVDLVKADRGLLKRYLGEAGAERFLNYHGGGPSGIDVGVA
jgi:putative hemolysin